MPKRHFLHRRAVVRRCLATRFDKSRADGAKRRQEFNLIGWRRKLGQASFTFIVCSRGPQVGNEDMHLKDFSLITRNEKVELAPAYDFLNTTIALKGAKEEMALPVKGKKSRLTHNDLLKYFARERLQINERVMNDVLSRFGEAMPAWRELLDQSFLSADAKQKYAALLSESAKRMQL